MELIKYVVLPILTASFLSSYINDFYDDNFSITNNFIMLFTIIVFCYLYMFSPLIKSIKYSVPSTWYGKIGSIIISNSYLFSLPVLFFIGLSAINILHTGLMIMCLMFMSQMQNFKEYWNGLIVYIVFIIFIRYLCSMIFNVNEDSYLLLEIIGLQVANYDNILGLKYEYLI